MKTFWGCTMLMTVKCVITVLWKGSIVQNVEIESFGLIFSLKFVNFYRVKYQKKVPLATGPEFQVPIPYRFKCERYPTLDYIKAKNYYNLP